MISILLTLVPLAVADAPQFELRDGDRVVFIGGTIVEQEQRYGHWESALTRCYPDRHVTFRNLGWSGDTVWGESRAGFDSAAQGYDRLVKHTIALKPTVLIVGYGANESFTGAAGLDRFEKQLNKLLDDLAVTKARVVLLSPLRVDETSWPRGSAGTRNRDIQLYADAIRRIGEKRGARFADEFFQRYGPPPTTVNGVHLTAFGYYWTTQGFVNELKAPSPELTPIELDGTNVTSFRQAKLIGPPVPTEPLASGTQADSLVRAKNLKPGQYTLMIDGKPVHTEDAAVWMSPPFKVGVLVPRGPSLDQSEKLRRAIVAKNQLYFHRWRPQNETYLFGFRKHEQGQNAREIPEFDPLIEAKEKEIATLRQPVEHRYQLVPAKEGR
jgi:hypothetical protein